VPRPAGGPSASVFTTVSATGGADQSRLTNDGFSFRRGWHLEGKSLGFKV